VKKQYLVQTRDSTGGFQTRSMFGTRSGLSWTAWRTVDRCDDLAAAQQALDLRKARGGLVEYRIRYGKEIVSR
jgi:hypothetical protein